MIRGMLIAVLAVLFVIITAPQAEALTEEEINFYLLRFFQADERKDAAQIARITGVSEEEVEKGLEEEKEYFAKYALELGYKYLSHKWTDGKIIFISSYSNTAFVSQVIVLKLIDKTNALKKQDFFTILEIRLNENGTLRWWPLGQSRGKIKEVGKGS